jgi:hypothetical protein
VAVSETSWAGLSACSSLTRLVLKFLPVHSDWEDRVERSLGLKRPATAVGGGMPVLRLEHLPAGLRELQLSGCYVGVPAQGCLNAGCVCCLGTEFPAWALGLLLRRGLLSGRLSC